ncbi:MAG TPA: hypothetical protein DD706_18225 [Nitrospiraceae bacterium]|nr:hypothetical protein [Nitrospiraceae bacterium]
MAESHAYPGRNINIEIWCFLLPPLRQAAGWFSLTFGGRAACKIFYISLAAVNQSSQSFPCSPKSILKMFIAFLGYLLPERATDDLFKSIRHRSKLREFSPDTPVDDE